MAESNAFIGFDGFYYVFVNNTGSSIKITFSEIIYLLTIDLLNFESGCGKMIIIMFIKN